jgi:hypothetical protein
MDGLLVRGYPASLNEYNVSIALDRLRLDYHFQVMLNGGRERRGGVVLDFLVFTAPKPTPVQVHGEYWHTGSHAAEDLLKEQVLRENPEWFEPVTIWGKESNTVEDALCALRRELMI